MDKHDRDTLLPEDGAAPPSQPPSSSSQEDRLNAASASTASPTRTQDCQADLPSRDAVLPTRSSSSGKSANGNSNRSAGSSSPVGFPVTTKTTERGYVGYYAPNSTADAPVVHYGYSKYASPSPSSSTIKVACSSSNTVIASPLMRSSYAGVSHRGVMNHSASDRGNDGVASSGAGNHAHTHSRVSKDHLRSGVSGGGLLYTTAGGERWPGVRAFPTVYPVRSVSEGQDRINQQTTTATTASSSSSNAANMSNDAMMDVITTPTIAMPNLAAMAAQATPMRMHSPRECGSTDLRLDAGQRPLRTHTHSTHLMPPTSQRHHEEGSEDVLMRSSNRAEVSPVSRAMHSTRYAQAGRSAGGGGGGASGGGLVVCRTRSHAHEVTSVPRRLCAVPSSPHRLSGHRLTADGRAASRSSVATKMNSSNDNTNTNANSSSDTMQAVKNTSCMNISSSRNGGEGFFLMGGGTAQTKVDPLYSSQHDTLQPCPGKSEKKNRATELSSPQDEPETKAHDTLRDNAAKPPTRTDVAEGQDKKEQGNDNTSLAEQVRVCDDENNNPSAQDQCSNESGSHEPHNSTSRESVTVSASHATCPTPTAAAAAPRDTDTSRHHSGSTVISSSSEEEEDGDGQEWNDIHMTARPTAAGNANCITQTTTTTTITAENATTDTTKESMCASHACSRQQCHAHTTPALLEAAHTEAYYNRTPSRTTQHDGECTQVLPHTLPPCYRACDKEAAYTGPLLEVYPASSRWETTTEATDVKEQLTPESKPLCGSLRYSLHPDSLTCSVLHRMDRAALTAELLRRRARLQRQLRQLQRETAEHNIFALVRTSNASQLQALLQRDVTHVRRRDYNDCTPLHVAATEGNLTAVRVLLSFGADVYATDREGRTPLDCAAANRHGGVGRYLLGILQGHRSMMHTPTHVQQHGATPGESRAHEAHVMKETNEDEIHRTCDTHSGREEPMHASARAAVQKQSRVWSDAPTSDAAVLREPQASHSDSSHVNACLKQDSAKEAVDSSSGSSSSSSSSSSKSRSNSGISTHHTHRDACVNREPHTPVETTLNNNDNNGIHQSDSPATLTRRNAEVAHDVHHDTSNKRDNHAVNKDEPNDHDIHDIENNAKMHVSHWSFCSLAPRGSLIVCMVGLPGRGKSFIGTRLARYMNWNGVPCELFNAGRYRRQLLGAHATAGADFFNPDNAQAKQLREKMAELACEGLVSFLARHPVAVGILDATNTTRRRRQWVRSYFADKARQCQVSYRLLFIESVCTDEAIVTENILRSKCENDDFKTVKATGYVLDEFRQRIKQYERVYEPLSVDEQLSFIKIINVKHHVVMHRVSRGLSSRIAFFLMNLHPVAYPIYLAVAGESIGDAQGVLGGDERLTERGEAYSRALRHFVQDRYVPHMILLHATNNSVMNTLRPILLDQDTGTNAATTTGGNGNHPVAAAHYTNSNSNHTCSTHTCVPDHNSVVMHSPTHTTTSTSDNFNMNNNNNNNNATANSTISSSSLQPAASCGSMHAPTRSHACPSPLSSRVHRHTAPEIVHHASTAKVVVVNRSATRPRDSRDTHIADNNNNHSNNDDDKDTSRVRACENLKQADDASATGTAVGVDVAHILATNDLYKLTPYTNSDDHTRHHIRTPDEAHMTLATSPHRAAKHTHYRSQSESAAHSESEKRKKEAAEEQPRQRDSGDAQNDNVNNDDDADDECRRSISSSMSYGSSDEDGDDENEEVADEVLCPVAGLDSINFGRFSGQSAEWIQSHYPRLSNLLHIITAHVDERRGERNSSNNNKSTFVDGSAAVHDGQTCERPVSLNIQDVPTYFQHIPADTDPRLAYSVQFPSGESCRQVSARLEPALMAIMRTQSPVFVVCTAIPAQGILAFFADIKPELFPTLRLPQHCVVELGVKNDVTVHPLLPGAMPPWMVGVSKSPNMDPAEAERACRFPSGLPA